MGLDKYIKACTCHYTFTQFFHCPKSPLCSIDPSLCKLQNHFVDIHKIACGCGWDCTESNFNFYLFFASIQDSNQVLYINLVSCNLLITYQFQDFLFFLVNSFRLPTQEIDSYVNKESFIFSTSISMPFISFSCLNALASTFNIMLKGVVRGESLPCT